VYGNQNFSAIIRNSNMNNEQQEHVQTECANGGDSPAQLIDGTYPAARKATASR